MRRLLSALILCLISPVLHAQFTNYSTGNTFNNPGSALIDTFIRSKMNRDLFLKSMPRREPRMGASVVASPPADAARTTSARGVRRKLPGLVASSTDGLGVQERVQLEQRLCQAIDEYETQSGKPGDVAHAISFLLGVSLQITRSVEISDADLEELARAVQQKIQADPQWAGLNREQRQLVYEESLIQATFILMLAGKGE